MCCCSRCCQDDLDVTGEQQCCCAFCHCGKGRGLVISTAVVFLFSAFLIGSAVYLPPFIEGKLDAGILRNLRLTPESRQKQWSNWRRWVDNSKNPYTLEVFAWNITNPVEVLEGKPANLSQVGPYFYIDYRKKFNTSWEQGPFGGLLLKYHEWQYYIFDRERTAPNLDPFTDTICTVNVVFQGLAATTGVPHHDNLGEILTSLYDKPGMTDLDRLFVYTSVHNITWGYESPVLQELHKTIPVHTEYPGLVKNYSLGELVKQRRHAIYSGMHFKDKARQFFYFRGETHVKAPVTRLFKNLTGYVWPEMWANRIWGTDATQFSPHLSKGMLLPSFVEQLCREIMIINRNGETIDHKDVELYRFYLPLKGQLNGSANHWDTGYNMRYQGTINITTCHAGIPIIMSNPHFWDSPHSLKRNVRGIHPNPKHHETFVAVEPYTGVTMKAAKRLQVNAELKTLNFTWSDLSNKKHHYLWFPKLAEHLVMPIIWIDNNGAASDKQVDQLKREVYLPRDIKDGIHYGAGISGIVLSVFAVFMLCYTFRYWKNEYSGVGMDTRIFRVPSSDLNYNLLGGAADRMLGPQGNDDVDSVGTGVQAGPSNQQRLLPGAMASDM